MNSDLRSNCWPIQRIGEALEAVARRSGLSPRPVKSVRAPAWLSDAMQETLKEWVDVAAASLDIEALPSQFPYCDAESFVENCGPAIVRVEFGEPENDTRLLLILRQKWRGLEILCPDLTTRIVKASQIRDLLCQPLEEPLVADVERLLDEAQIAGRRRARVGSSILRERLSVTPIDAGWLLRLRPSRRFSEQVSEARIRRRLFAFVTAHTAEYLLALFSWWIIGRGALEGRLDYGWLLAWILLLATRIPFRLAATWFQGLVAISGGALVKRRLLAGALKLRPEEMRTEGVGHLLGRVIESEALESLALNGALTGIVSVIEIVIAAAILLLAAESLPLSLLLLAWTVVLGALTWRYMRRRDHWTSKRLEITNELVERMAGRRTRLAQEPREKWHESEDEMLERYVEDCRRMDRSLIPLSAIVPRGWTVTALICVAFDFISGVSTPAALAIAFGGILLADGALRRLTAGLAYLSGACVAWKQVRALYESGSREDVAGISDIGTSTSSEGAGFVLDVRDVSHKHEGRSEETLRECSLRIAPGDRILVEGPSGGGKSTLVSLVTGVRKPASGLVTLGGLDYSTLGARAWRRKVAAAPQFHENHIFSNTLAFNLLLGRRWPPQPEDMEEAEAVCRELGLGQLLDRMPAGLLQMVGETGWQLSYGERSRIFIARALLQRSPLIVLDESFGSLDPETLQQAMHCVRDRAPTLMVIAHP